MCFVLGGFWSLRKPSNPPPTLEERRRACVPLCAGLCFVVCTLVFPLFGLFFFVFRPS